MNDPLNLEQVDANETLAVIQASVARRYFGLGVLYSFGAILLYIAAATPPSDIKWLAFLILVAVGDLVVAEMFRRATLCSIRLTKEGMYCSDGKLMVAIDNIKSVERGVFAFKPSNGFMVTTKERQSRVWAPGLWWRVGKRVGVGGVLHASQTKNMAEMLVALSTRHQTEN
ncbi:hypothetical protein OU789_03675 [Halocynthiibacter sp. C4]|uniref:hypothetical protein n=1 Tax=Halocynthiibacter sp. C4 TaxID=2992758 RepID=UPI00237A8DD9|nr:hypothetical protein [Halocynthiibacter sp. C4]MDE0589021.1 hypothetical protein [Halocynthiibacter sp. C4]